MLRNPKYHGNAPVSNAFFFSPSGEGGENPIFYHSFEEERVTRWRGVRVCCSHPGTASGHGLGQVMAGARLSPLGRNLHSMFLEGINGEVIFPSPSWGNFQIVWFFSTTEQNKV